MATDGVIKGTGDSRLIKSPASIPTDFAAFRQMLIDTGLPIDLLFNPAGWDIIGNALNKLFFLTDSTETAIWGNAANRTPNEALAALDINSRAYAVCTTAAATVAKTVSIPGFVRRVGGAVSVKFNNAVPANATLNIEATGAANMRIGTANITAGVINAGDTALLVWTGSVWQVMSVDRGANAPTSLQVKAYAIAGTYTFTAPRAGYYEVEVKAGQTGNASGAYAMDFILLTAGQSVTVTVGEYGTDAISTASSFGSFLTAAGGVASTVGGTPTKGLIRISGGNYYNGVTNHFYGQGYRSETLIDGQGVPFVIIKWIG